MITKTTRTFESFEEFINNRDVAAVGDTVLISEESEIEKAPYIVADENILVRKYVMADPRPMKTSDFDLLKWLDGEFKECIVNNLPEELRSKIGTVTVPTIREVYGCDKFDMESTGEQMEWFKNPENRIALWEDEDYSAYWWLRDPVSASNFAFVYGDGLASCGSASNAWIGVRPAFGVC